MGKSFGVRISGRHSIFDRFAGHITRMAGSSWAFVVAVSIVVIWALAGPMLDYSQSWQLVINTGTTIITFLMVFLIQQSQNKDSLALHIKLNELIASNKLASNQTIAVEGLDAADLELLHAFYLKLAELAQQEHGLKRSHSLDDAGDAHRWKTKASDRFAMPPHKGSKKPE